MKKAQLMSQPFYYIFIVIVIALVLIFGFNLINKLQNTQEKAKFIQFKTDFNQDINNVYLQNPGSRSSFSLLLPEDVKQVCFKTNNLITKISSSESNYFQSFNVDNLVSNNHCIKIINNRLSFTLENKIVNQKTIVEIL